jgi:hypothetical protein
MQTYRQYLLEGKRRAGEYTATDYITIDGVNISTGNIFNLDSKGNLHKDGGPAVIGRFTPYRVWMKHGFRHRLDGPAVINGDGTSFWYVDGVAVADPHVPWILREEMLWKLLKTNIENNLPVLNRYMTPEMQEYICKTRPDLVGRIENLDPDLAEKYSHEKELGNIDL